jgi:hypothetical protein
MSNPTRRMRKTIAKITRGVCEASHGLKRAAASRLEAMAPISEGKHSFAIEILAIWIRQLIFRAIDLGIGWLVQKVMRRRKAARMIPFPYLRPAP